MQPPGQPSPVGTEYDREGAIDSGIDIYRRERRVFLLLDPRGPCSEAKIRKPSKIAGLSPLSSTHVNASVGKSGTYKRLSRAWRKRGASVPQAARAQRSQAREARPGVARGGHEACKARAV